MPSQIKCTKSEAEDIAYAMSRFACIGYGVPQARFPDITPIVNVILGHENPHHTESAQQPPEPGLIRASEEVISALQREEGKHLFRCACGFHTNRWDSLKRHLKSKNAHLRACADRSEGALWDYNYLSPVCDHRARDWFALNSHMKTCHGWMQGHTGGNRGPGSGGEGNEMGAGEWWYVEWKCRAV